MEEVRRHYNKQIQLTAIENGHIGRDIEDSIKQRLAAALFKFRFAKQEVSANAFIFFGNRYIIKQQQIQNCKEEYALAAYRNKNNRNYTIDLAEA